MTGLFVWIKLTALSRDLILYDNRTPSDNRTFFQNGVLNLPLYEGTCDKGTPVMYGHLSWILRCPFMTGFAVPSRTCSGPSMFNLGDLYSSNNPGLESQYGQ